jgi:hypothetical protein
MIRKPAARTRRSKRFPITRRTLILAVSILLLPTGRMAQAAPTPVNIIFDTDVDHDCDDIGALFVLHGAVARGEAKLLATIGCTSSDAIAPCLDAINTWFGHPEIPVGTLKEAEFLDHQGFGTEILKRYPKKWASGQDYPDAVKLYRRILMDQPNGSVVMLAVGPLRNMANLLQSPPDDLSPLDGRALVAQKVKRLDVMGGTYPPSNAKGPEWNFKQDPASAALVCSDWPTPILFNGDGGSTNSGRRVTYEMPEHNPLTMAYRLYPAVGFAGDRLSWDLISSLVATRGAEPWYSVVGGGTNVTDPATGINVWKEGEQGRHSYLVLKSPKWQVEKELEDMLTAGRPRPKDLQFNTVYYADSGMCRVTQTGERNDHGVWEDMASSSWIQYQHVDGRKRLVTSYVLECSHKDRQPRTVALDGSNDGGTTWTALDTQRAPGFDEATTRREFVLASPAKWNLYRLTVTAANEADGVRVDAIELNERIHCQPGTAVAAVALDQHSVTLPVDGRATLNATITPLDSFERQVVWSSSDPQTAEVRPIGEQTAIVVGRKKGTCAVSATIDGVQRVCLVTVQPSTLPPGWQYDELNAPPIPGSVDVSDNQFTLTGSGHAMTSWWERVRDQGVFVSRSVRGDATLSACLTSLTPNVGGPSYKWDHRPPTVSGLMIRESLTEAAGRYVLVQLSASGRLTCRWRDKSGDQDDNQVQELGTLALPVHLKIEQTTGEIRIYASTDGREWGEPRLSHRAAFDTSSRIGLFVCSGNTFASTTAVFNSVEARD